MIRLRTYLCCLLLLLATATSAQADLITDLIGDVNLNNVPLDIENVTNATTIGRTVHFSGTTNSVAQVQTYNLDTKTIGSVQSATGLSGTGSGSLIFEIRQLADGTPIYYGGSQLGSTNSVATYWTDLNSPIQATNHVPGSSGIFSGALNGTFAGDTGGSAAVGQIGGNLEFLIGGGGLFVNDISSDAELIVGGDIWRQTPSGYEKVDHSGFGNDGGRLSLDGSFSGVEIDPVTGLKIIAGGAFDLTTFESLTGFWYEDGSYIGDFAGEFQDFQIIEGQLVAGLTDFNDTTLIALTDFSQLSLFDLTGTAFRIENDSLFEGSLGFAMNSGDGSVRFSTYSTSAVPEPSSLLLLSLGGLGLLRRKRKPC